MNVKKEEQQLLQQIHLAYNDVMKTSLEFAQLLLGAYQSIEKIDHTYRG